MKLNTAQVARTMSQLQVEALPEDHPLVPQLNRIFGDQVDCSWTDENGQPNDAVFPASVLHKF